MSFPVVPCCFSSWGSDELDKIPRFADHLLSLLATSPPPLFPLQLDKNLPKLKAGLFPVPPLPPLSIADAIKLASTNIAARHFHEAPPSADHDLCQKCGMLP